MQNSHNTSRFWSDSAQELRNIRSLAACAILIAIGIVLKQFTINTPIIKIGFAVLPLAMTGFLFGPFMAGIAAAVLDLIGFLFYPGMGLIPGLVLTSFIGGFVWGCMLYHRPITIWRTLAATAIHSIIVSFLLTPFFLSPVIGTPILALMWVRVPKNAIMIPLNTALIFTLQQAIAKTRKLIS